jgi:2-phosphosulfolactate phosphatase
MIVDVLSFSTCVDIATARGAVILLYPWREWSDGSLRPAFEDMLGAGAIIKGLAEDCSPEAFAAMAVFEQCHADLPDILKRCASGKELIERGFETDVVLAGQVDVSQSAPRLQAACYTDDSRATSTSSMPANTGA